MSTTNSEAGLTAIEQFEAAYQELKAMVARLAREQPHGTLTPTVLMSEVFIKLFSSPDRRVNNHDHLRGLVFKASQQVVRSHIRYKQAEMRDWRSRGEMPADVPAPNTEQSYEYIHKVTMLLDRLQEENPTAAQILKAKYFSEATNEAIAAAHGVSVSTVEKKLKAARLWLQSHLRESTP